MGASVWCQDSPVSIPVARGSGALLSIHCRGIQPQDALKGEFLGLSHVAAGYREPWTCDGDLRELHIVPIGNPKYCGLGRGLSDYTGFGAMEERLISS